ncbi:PfkB family carbohydrate kinase [Kineococcus aurantiacus]
MGSGAAAVDDLLFLASALTAGKGRVVRREQRIGGNIATALIIAARAGARTAFTGYLPGAASGSHLLAALREEGIDLSTARLEADTHPIRSTILVDATGERFIAFDDDTAIGMPEDADLHVVRQARVLLLDAYGAPGGLRAATAARRGGVDVVVDIEQVRGPQTRQLLDVANHLILPLAFARTLTGAATAMEAVNALWREDKTAVVVTSGDNGSWYRSPASPRVEHRPAELVAVVDTTGCGDAFHGAYAAALAGGMDLPACIEAATLAAAECATHAGGIAPRTMSTSTT